MKTEKTRDSEYKAKLLVAMLSAVLILIAAASSFCAIERFSRLSYNEGASEISLETPDLQGGKKDISHDSDRAILPDDDLQLTVHSIQ